ncbi:GATA zinc finger domain-containing protein 4-like [Teleopsis dalmanni]|nr:GATA zinc finger domain-containing protein 4-like [Teleopsis dalmanni]
MPYLRSSDLFDAQYLQANQYFEMNETDGNSFSGANNNFYSCENPEVSYTVNNMHMNTTDSMERSQSFIMQFDSSHPWYSGQAANRVQNNVNSNNIVINPTQNFYETTQTIPSSTIASAENITSTNTNPLTRNSSMPTSVNTNHSNQLTASYTASLGLTESNSSQFHDSAATNDNFINGNNYESNVNQSYNNWIYGNNENYMTESNNINYETNLMRQSDEFSEFLSNVDIKTESDPGNQNNRTSTPDSSGTLTSVESTPPRNKNTSATSNPDRIKFVTENIIQIGPIFYSRTVKLKSSIYVNPNYIPNQRDNSIEDQGSNININQESESQLYTNIVKRKTKSDTSLEEGSDTSEEEEYELSGSGESSADESIENSQIDNTKEKENVCRLKSQCITHRQLTQRHKSYSNGKADNDHFKAIKVFQLFGEWTTGFYFADLY